MISDTALAAIEAVDLNPAQYRTAIRLAQLCADGPVHLSYDEALTACGTTSDHTVRGHLSALRCAGLIGYRRNAVVAIWWIGGSQSDRVARDSRATRSEIDDNVIATRANRAPHDHEDAGEPEQRAPHDQIARSTRESRATRSNRAPHAQPKGYPNNRQSGRQAGYPSLPKPGEGSGGAPSPAQQSRTVALLTDDEVGIDGELARAIAAEWPFEQVVRQVFRLRHDMAAGKVRSPGVLLTRLRQGYAATVTDADKRSALWQRHADAGDEEAERRRRYIPDDLADIIIGGGQ